MFPIYLSLIRICLLPTPGRLDAGGEALCSTYVTRILTIRLVRRFENYDKNWTSLKAHLRDKIKCLILCSICIIVWTTHRVNSCNIVFVVVFFLG